MFKREGDPVVQLVEQGGAIQRTLVPGAGGVELLNIARLGEVRAVMQIEGPTHIPPLRVGAKNARKRESQIDESTGGANRTLRGDHRSAAGVRAKNNGGSAIDRGNRRSAGETSNIIVVREELAAEEPSQVASAIVFANQCEVTRGQLEFPGPTVGGASHCGTLGEGSLEGGGHC